LEVRFGSVVARFVIVGVAVSVVAGALVIAAIGLTRTAHPHASLSLSGVPGSQSVPANKWVTFDTVALPRSTTLPRRSAPLQPRRIPVEKVDAASQAQMAILTPLVENGALAGLGLAPKSSTDVVNPDGTSMVVSEFSDRQGTDLTITTTQLRAPVALEALTLGSSADPSETLADGTVEVIVNHAAPYTLAVYLVSPSGQMTTATAGGRPADGVPADMTIAQLEAVARSVAQGG
jgi:hypothetical protein